MEFLSVDGAETLSGEVWSPGPVAGSVWVLLADGSRKAVRLASKSKPAQVVNVARGKYAEPREWTEEYGRMVLLSAWSRLDAKYAPALPRWALLDAAGLDLSA